MRKAQHESWRTAAVLQAMANELGQAEGGKLPPERLHDFARVLEKVATGMMLAGRPDEPVH